MTIAIKKNEFLGKLSANLPRHVSLPVVHAIVDHLDPILGIAFARYEKYAEVAATGLRTVARTIPALHRQCLLKKKPRHNGPPLLWLPEIMDMQADEALRRAAWLAHHKDENPQNYFTTVNGNVAESAEARPASERALNQIDVEGKPKATNALNSSLHTGTQLNLQQQRRAKPKSPAYANDREILGLVHSEWDARGLTPQDPQALTKAIHALGNSWPQRFKNMDVRALRKAYQRARGRLPVGYERWIALVEKWDKSYNRQKARKLVDRVVTAVGNRPRGILDRMFDYLEKQICDHLPKKVARLECECERLEENEYYIPQLRDLKPDAFSEKVYAELADGPMTKRELARMFGKTLAAISSVGLRLRNQGRITSIWRSGQFMWARASTEPQFIPARDAIIVALRKGPMTISALAQETGKGTSTVKSALHWHLLPNCEVVRAERGTYALAGTAPQYVSKCDAIIAALKNGPMTFQALVREVGSTPTSLPQFLDLLLVKGKVIRIRRGIYALPGSAPVYVPTSDLIITALTKKPMKRGLLVQHVNKSTKTTRSRGAIGNVLDGLIKQGRVLQEQPYGEYCLVRRARHSRDTARARDLKGARGG